MDKPEDELEKLVLMAEKISDTVAEINTKITNLKVMSMVAMICLYISIGAATYLFIVPEIENISFALYSVLITVALITSAGSVLFLSQYFMKIQGLRRTLNSEKEILHNLLNMVFEYKDHLHNEDVSFVDNAILEMRLKRIKFSTM